MSAIKINRAFARSKIGSCPGSRSAMLRTIPQTVIAALSSAQLAELLDATWTACQTAKRIAERNAINEGAIWDGQRLREIAA